MLSTLSVLLQLFVFIKLDLMITDSIRMPKTSVSEINVELISFICEYVFNLLDPLWKAIT